MKNLRSKIIAVIIAILLVGGAYVAGLSASSLPQIASAAVPVYDQSLVTGIYENASPAVVEIEVTQQGTGFYGRSVQEGQGSGFLVDNQGHILTNNHVVDGASSVQVVLKDGTNLNATVAGTDSINDLAVITVNASSVSGITPLQFGDSSVVKPGQLAIALGSPYGLSDSITVGVISGVNRSLSNSGMTGMLQTDAAINPGNSGGPLLDAQGKVIGINTAVEAASGSRGIGFAVASNTASNALPSLIVGKQVTRPWLGISGTALTESKAKNLGISVNQGVYVVTVVPNGPADKAGIKGGGTDSSGALASGGDVITVIDSNSVASVEELSAYIGTKQVGDKVTLALLRNGQSMSVQVTLEAWPTNSQSTIPQIPYPDFPMPWGHRSP